ncbi:MAG: O-methyltransferase [Nitrososphaerales archaeon]
MPKTKDNEHPPIVTEEVKRYLEKIQRPRDRVLSDLEQDAEKNNVPIAGPLIGSTLSIIAKGCAARNILEIGTATGYSGIWLARGIENGSGKLTTIEMDPERQKFARSAFERAGLGEDRVEMILGDASKIVPDIAKSRPSSFDIVFMDVGEKKLYSDLLDSCLGALRKGGLFIVDDTLYRGVAVSSLKTKKAKTMRAFNKRLFSDERVEPEILPIGDGLTIAIKK